MARCGGQGSSPQVNLERRYGGPAGYGHVGWVQNPPGPYAGWSKVYKPPPRTPFAVLAGRLGLRLGAAGTRLLDCVTAPGGPGIYDQGSTSSCTGHSECGSAMTSAVAAGHPTPYRLSPACAYKLGRIVDEPLAQPLTDDGAVPEQVTRGCQEWGICSWDDDPTDPATINVRPDLFELEHALRLPVSGIYGMSGSDVEAQIQTAVTNGFPVKLGFLVDQACENWSGGDPLGPPVPASVLGGHSIYCVWVDQWAGGVEYYLVNSWGVGYGEGGFVRVSSDFIRQASDFEVVKYGWPS